MAKITELPPHIAVDADPTIDVIPLVESGETRKITINEFLVNSIGINYVGKITTTQAAISLTKSEVSRLTVPAGYAAGSVFRIVAAFGDSSADVTRKYSAWIDIVPVGASADATTPNNQIINIDSTSTPGFTGAKTLSVNRLVTIGQFSSFNTMSALPQNMVESFGMLNGAFGNKIPQGFPDNDLGAGFDLVFSVAGENDIGDTAVQCTLINAFVTGFKP